MDLELGTPNFIISIICLYICLHVDHLRILDIYALCSRNVDFYFFSSAYYHFSFSTPVIYK